MDAETVWKRVNRQGRYTNKPMKFTEFVEWHQQEIAKAQIRILKQEQSWIEDVNRDIGWSIGQTIDSLSQTLKEHKE